MFTNEDVLCPMLDVLHFDSLSLGIAEILEVTFIEEKGKGSYLHFGG